MKNMKIGDMCKLVNVYPDGPEMCMIVREIRHPYLDFMKAYAVLDAKGKEHKVSETFLQPVV